MSETPNPESRSMPAASSAVEQALAELREVNQSMRGLPCPACAEKNRRAYRDRNRHMSEIEQAIHLLQTKVAEIRRDAAKPHPVEDAHFIATSVAEADAIDTVIAALPPHEWRYDERAQVYRCWKCLVRSDRPHERTCAVTLTVTCD